MELILIRHGESVANAAGIIQGHLDAVLSLRGEAQVLALADYLRGVPLDAIYHSDLSRASATAMAIHAGRSVPLQADPRLREHGVGVCTGLTWEEVRVAHPEVYQALQEAGTWEVAPGAERDILVDERASAFLADVKRTHPRGRIAVVSHGGLIRRLLRQLLGTFPCHLDFDNASLTEIHLAPDAAPSLRYHNRIPYPPPPRGPAAPEAPLDRV